jgi:DNA-directed RNA polymerase specialized sigma24 family protein
LKIWDRYDDLLRIATKIAGREGMELAHDTIEKVSRYPEEHQERILAHFDAYMKVTMWRSFHGVTGSYRRKFSPTRTFEQEQSEGLDDSVILRELLDQQYRSLPKIERLIFDARFQTGIPTKDIARCSGWDVRKTRQQIQHIKEKIKHGIHKECLSC